MKGNTEGPTACRTFFRTEKVGTRKKANKATIASKIAF